MLSNAELSANSAATSIACGLMIAAICDLLVSEGIVTWQALHKALQNAKGTLGNDFTGRPDAFAAMQLVNAVGARLPERG